MASNSQPNTNDFHHSQTLDGNSRIGDNAHGLAVAASSAAGYATDNHLAGLVEAATAAAGQDVSWSQTEESDGMMAGHGRQLQNHIDGYGAGMHLDDGFGDNQVHFGGMGSADGSRQLRNSTTSLGVGRNGSQGSRKRKRRMSNVDPAITGDNGQYDAGSGVQGGGGDGLDIREVPPQQALSDARAAGVHSAVALFRQPSSSSKKYTRPPMSKLFTSLELSPENFLHLQAAAKAYMLDEAHPERRDCVGQRGKGDTELVKLRLWNCVRDFLDIEGHGNRYFGEHAVNEGIGPRTIIWPRDEQKIISLVMPLLRRMVTNERQRQYAVETRSKVGAAGEKKKKQTGGYTSNIPSEPGHTFHPPPPNTNLQLGMTDLLAEGYPTDWDSITRAYDMYNQDYRLDNLGSISGLQQQDWWGLVAAVDCHYQVVHNGVGSDCSDACESYNINHIVSSDSAVNADWRINPQGDDMSAWNYFASGITRDVSHIIRDNLSSKADFHQQNHNQHPAAPLIHKQHDVAEQSAPSTTTPIIPSHQITLRINILQPRSTTTNNSSNTNKRILPRLDITADQCPDFQSLIQRIRQYCDQQQGQQHIEQFSSVKVWLEGGLVLVQNDAEWIVALMAASTVEWMDAELRVVVDSGGANSQD